MDYSLLVGVDEEKHELVLGIIDFMRQYTWDKHLETWVKASGILGGPKNESPTIISPKQYKKRFRKAMTTYFLMVPDQWSPPSIIPSKSQTDLCEEENMQGGWSAGWFCKICLYIEHIIGFLALGSQLHTSPIFSIPILLERSSSCILPKVGEHMISCQSTW